MQEQEFLIEADIERQLEMREAAAALVQRTRAAWRDNRDLSQFQTGKRRPAGWADRRHLASSYLKLLAAEL